MAIANVVKQLPNLANQARPHTITRPYPDSFSPHSKLLQSHTHTHTINELYQAHSTHLSNTATLINTLIGLSIDSVCCTSVAGVDLNSTDFFIVFELKASR